MRASILCSVIISAALGALVGQVVRSRLYSQSSASAEHVDSGPWDDRALELVAIYGLEAQYETADEQAMLAELSAVRDAYAEISIPLFNAELELGHCEVLSAEDRGGRSRSNASLEATEYRSGLVRRVVLNPAQHPSLLELKIRMEWLQAECLARGIRIPVSPSEEE
jgi:hypothetical protein